MQYFIDAVRNQTSDKSYLLELTKSRSKVHKNNSSRELALNLTDEKDFRKTISQ